MKRKRSKPAPSRQATFIRLSDEERADLRATGQRESRDMSKQLLHAARVGWRALYGRELGSGNREAAA